MNIVLTGASKGIGFETALALSNYKLKNLILISRNKEGLQILEKKIQNINKQVNIKLIAEDINSISEQPEILLSKLNFESVDIIINNAGLLINKPFAEISQPEAENMFRVNVLVPMQLVRICFDKLKASPASHVLNIGSMGGFQGSSKFAGLSYYSASKAALAVMSECLATEFQETNIRFNCLALGAVQTEMLEEAFPGYQAPISSENMGRYIADFAINGHKYYNGKILPVSISNP
ncbi:MAG: SDR family oxidoreductase [Bacteroidales bacterium]|nr:SDR family oxidoreductase [Bacteroidales bacterium]MBN2820175.1 SDR family oxidoreductase [Bacteroidales bacterium]